jgi:hypothetical protein
VNTARQTGSVIGVALFGALAAANLTTGLHRDLIIAVVAALVAATLTTVMDREPWRIGGLYHRLLSMRRWAPAYSIVQRRQAIAAC